ncbi:hypothetical protein Tco_0336205 [Tanacetum coccineum]
MEGYTLKQLKGFKFEVIKDMFDRAFMRVNTFVDHEKELIEESSKKGENEKEINSKRTREELESDKSKKQKLDEKVEAEVDDAKEAEELKQCLEIVPDDGDDVIFDATPLSVKMPIMLKNFDREDIEVLWSIVKARFKKTEPVNYMDTFLHLNLKTMFEHHLKDNLQVDYECEMAFEFLRLVKKQLKEDYGRIRIKSLLEVTAVKLVLLVQKLLLLVLKVNDAGIKVTTVERLQLSKG